MIEAFGLTSNTRKARPPAVDDVSFAARTGHVTALLGVTGAGKTTVLGLMLELRPGRGITYFRGRPLHRIAHPSREVGTLLGDVPGHPARSVRGHLRMLCAAAGVPVRRADEVLEVTGLVSLREERLDTLSRGMDRRLGLACALLPDPHTLVLDEPTDGLSVREERWLHGMLRAHASQGGTVLYTTADPKEAARAADRVVTLDGGRLVADQEAGEFARTRLRPRVAVRSPHAARLAALLTKEARTARRSVEVVPEGGNRLSVYGSTTAEIGEVAFRHGILVHQLADEVGDTGPGAGAAPGGGAGPAGRAPAIGRERAVPAGERAVPDSVPDRWVHVTSVPAPDWRVRAGAGSATSEQGTGREQAAAVRSACRTETVLGWTPVEQGQGRESGRTERRGPGAEPTAQGERPREAPRSPAVQGRPETTADVPTGGTAAPGPASAAGSEDVCGAIAPGAGATVAGTTSDASATTAGTAVPPPPATGTAVDAPASGTSVPGARSPGVRAADAGRSRAGDPPRTGEVPVLDLLSPLPPPISVRPAPRPLRPLRYELRRATGIATGFLTCGAALMVSALTAVLLARLGHTPQARLFAAWPRQVPLPPAALAAGLLGALAFGDEFRHPALAADGGTVPRRLGLLTAKLLVAAVTAVTLAFLTVGCDAEVLYLVYGRELTQVPGDWLALTASWFGLVVACAWVGVLAAGVFRSTTAGLATVLAVPVVIVPLVHEALRGPAVPMAAGLPLRMRQLLLLQWSFGGERYLIALIRIVAQPLGVAMALSLTALLCAYVFTALRTRAR
ncbi:ATP-binding cassette domain-containing protein [Streptomyces sp. TG1A-8]|uniref:ATP-binding cassette domain-containing protein n=1 Tax=Streptomyces sp. TG1A-8 TaxID=3051385 RepID=UPI00265BF8D1|nr:ATP-binding cassette domain-containing protein [Streptomyces sp. TG1A-8]MDO0925380.1 ATP-binding cassette domain-containing protein [Streptomyces sp. TG1A-8]